ncbi:MAG: hypothetical protein ISS16_02180 [Ignavibacteria bacterium]|nr:hypothetical protein [Ignavibacteria bacterium]
MSIFQIEIASKRLQNVLKIPASLKYKILSLINFFELIFKEPEQSIYNSYFEEFTPQFLVLINKLGQADANIFFSPEEIDDIKNVLSKVIQLRQSTTHEIKPFDFEHLESILAKEKEKALSYLDGSSGVVHKGEELSTDSVNIVLIEKNLDENNDSDFETGIIYCLNLSSSKRSRSEVVDKVEVNNLINIDKTQIVEQLNHVTAIAKRACSKQNIKTHYYNFTYFFELKEYIYTGSSLGIGGLVLAYNSILINEIYKYYFKFRNDTVFTAEIDKEGNLVKLDDKTLKIKLRAVFYSPYKKFVIPEENINEAKSELEALNRKYTKRELQLIPIKSFENVFKNLDIVERCELKLKDKIIANYRRYHTAVNWVLSISTLFIIIFFIINYLIPHLDRNPVNQSFENDRYVAYNKHGVKIFESEKLEEGNRDYYNHKLFKNNRFVLSDINGDGINEVLYLQKSHFNDLESRSIYCYKNTNNMLWKFCLPYKSLIYNGEHYNDKTNILCIFTVKIKDRKFQNIIYRGHYNEYFPYIIGVLDYNGNLISEYINAGHMSYGKVLDIDQDSKEEIIFAGVNNQKPYNCAATVIFDSDFIKGVSPKSDPLQDGKPGLEMYYILFPRSVVLEKFHELPEKISTQMPRNIVTGLIYNDMKILITTKECEEFPSPTLMYFFDEKMNLVNIDAEDYFEIKYRKLLINKIIPEIPLSEYLESLKSKVLWWDGDKFVNYPAINKHYLAAKDSVNKHK